MFARTAHLAASLFARSAPTKLIVVENLHESGIGWRGAQYSITELTETGALRVARILGQSYVFRIKHQGLQSSTGDLVLQYLDLASELLLFPIGFRILKAGDLGAVIDGIALDKMGSRLCMRAHHEKIGAKDDASPSRQFAVQPAPGKRHGA